MVRGLIISLLLLFTFPAYSQVLAGVLNQQSNGLQMKDTFTGAANTILSSHTADTGQTWTQFEATNWPGPLRLTGANIISGPLSAYSASLIPSSANYTVNAPMVLAASGAGWIMVLARLASMTGTGFNGYGCRWAQGTGVLLEKWTAGSNVQIGTTDTTFTTGSHVVAIKTLGTSITCLIDTVASANATGTDSTYSAAGAVGLAINQGSGAGYNILSPFTVQ